jgi:O-antigen/teichoic acid export membrane protein
VSTRLYEQSGADEHASLSSDGSYATFAKPRIDNLKRNSITGGIASLLAQLWRFLLQTGSVAVMARLLAPEDFGIQGMALVVMGLLSVFGDFGLSAATVQRDNITHEQLSTLFWINVGIGGLLSLIAAALSPFIVGFYHEPRLYAVTIVSSLAFLFSGMGAQHMALLQRNMRYGTMAKINVGSLSFSTVLGIVLAILGFRYWSLVASAISLPLFNAILAWSSMPWRPGKPGRGESTRSLLQFGGTVTCNMAVVYCGYNAEKLFLGRSWGADALGLYGRAYQLLNLPLQQLHASLYLVAFPALSRIQDDPSRLRDTFLKGYSLLLSLTIPMTLISALFAPEIVQILLGPKWYDAVPILQLLTPTILVLGMINPFGWFLIATGRTSRSLKMALVITPTVICSVAIALPYGPKGVALGYSIAMLLLLIPMLLWAMNKTSLTLSYYWKTIQVPALAGLLSGLVGHGFNLAITGALPWQKLLLGSMVVCLVFAGILLLFEHERKLYWDIGKQLLARKQRI